MNKYIKLNSGEGLTLKEALKHDYIRDELRPSSEFQTL
jgi:hypothetical protein